MLDAGLGAGCGRGGDRVVGKQLANCGTVDLWSQHGRARSHSKAVNVVDGALREHPYALMPEDDVFLSLTKFCSPDSGSYGVLIYLKQE